MPDDGKGPFSRFAAEVVDQRVAVLCHLAPKPILLDVIFVDWEMKMMKVKAVTPEGGNREWWLSLGAVVTVAVIPKEPNLVQTVPSGVVLF